jgi:SAM-dependent methyltransferase
MAHEKSTQTNERAIIEELLRKRPAHARLIQGILTGDYIPFTRSELEELAQKKYFSFKELSPLTKKEDALLKDTLPALLTPHLEGRLSALTDEVFFDGQEIFYFKGNTLYKDFCMNRSIQTLTSTATIQAKKLSARLLTPQEKLYVAFGVNTGISAEVVVFLKKVNKPDRASGWGNRQLTGEYGYMPKEVFDSVRDGIRKRTKKKTLSVLDIGGGVGKALFEMKTLDPNIETTNLTLEEEPLQLPVDHTVQCLAERMPDDFFERFDVVLSNVSFRYYSLPHKALQNAVLALSAGGQALLNIQTDSVAQTPTINEYYKPYTTDGNRCSGADALVKKERERLLRLQEKGYLTLVYHSTTFKANKDAYGTGFYDIVKLKPLSVEEYLNT